MIPNKQLQQHYLDKICNSPSFIFDSLIPWGRKLTNIYWITEYDHIWDRPVFAVVCTSGVFPPLKLILFVGVCISLPQETTGEYLLCSLYFLILCFLNRKYPKIIWIWSLNVTSWIEVTIINTNKWDATSVEITLPKRLFYMSLPWDKGVTKLCKELM